MADATYSQDQRLDNSHRGRGFHQIRPPYRGRGRGRGRGEDRFYNVHRALNELGVTDLREHLNRKHQQEQIRGGPPSDPSYNYLRDPLREDYDQSPKAANVQRSNSYSSRRGRGKPQAQEPSFIQNPLNIKVELSTSTGQRNYSLNDVSTLPDIRHIPDYQFPDLHERSSASRARGGRSIRARGRGRYNSEVTSQGEHLRAKSTERKHEERYENRGSQIRSRSVEAKGETSGENRGRGNYRPRGNYSRRSREDNKIYEGDNTVRDGESRGKVRGRGMGRGYRRGRGGQQRSIHNAEPHAATNEVVSEENWDKEECLESPDDNVLENKERHVGEDNQEYSEENQENSEETPENSEENEAHSKENQEESDLYKDYAEGQELDLVVTSSLDGKNKKRSVRFSLKDDDQNDGQNDVKDDKQIEESKG